MVLCRIRNTTMSSPVSPHEPDIPISGGSPLNVNSPDSPVPKLMSPNKDDTPSSKCSSPKVNGDNSCSSSPKISTPVLTPTPPANGILTPPREGDASDLSKPEKPAGRLKFYKDGILCLELSHHNEGHKTKWVQIRTKTVFPSVIHTTKEATIPCHVSPTSFSSPSSSNALQSRVESSTSHSMSDDGSSMLSSPRLRENTWKQPVPQKRISSCLEFFMKPALCVFNLRKLASLNRKSQGLKLTRKPYDCQIPNLKSSKTIVCSCINITDSFNVKKILLENGDAGNCESNTECESSDKPSLINGNGKSCTRTEKIGKIAKIKVSLKVITNRLKTLREQKQKEDLEIRHCQSADSKFTSGRIPTVPKKRVFRETESKDLSPTNRPKKKSPNRNHDAKTILNVPGLNSEFYRRHSTPLDVGGLTGQKVNSSIYHGTDFSKEKPSVLASSKSANKAGKYGTGKRLDNSSGGSYSLGAKALSPGRTSSKKTAVGPELVNDSVNSAMSLSSLPPQQQEIFKRQTMSKAISYTINSLLGSPGSNESGNKNSILKCNLDPAHSSLKTTKADKADKRTNSNNHSNIMSHRQHELPQGLFGARGEQDQNSFLRHLLDTSDPIPLVKPERIVTKQSMQSPSASSSRNNSKSSASETRSGASDLRKSTTSSKQTMNSNSSKASSSPLNLNSQQLGQYPSFIHPSVVNSAFPLSMSAAYDSLLRGQDPSSNALAAAAAAALQYQSLLPTNLFSNFNSSMAAAAAMASYLGGASNTAPRTTSSSSSSVSSRSPSAPRPQSSSPINYSSSSSPLNLSQRPWPSMGNGLIPPGSSIIPVPFHAPIGDSLHSVGGSPRYSGGRLEKMQDIIDNDTPLNLSKKPRPN